MATAATSDDSTRNGATQTLPCCRDRFLSGKSGQDETSRGRFQGLLVSWCRICFCSETEKSQSTHTSMHLKMAALRQGAASINGRQPPQWHPESHAGLDQGSNASQSGYMTAWSAVDVAQRTEGDKAPARLDLKNMSPRVHRGWSMAGGYIARVLRASSTRRRRPTHPPLASIAPRGPLVALDQGREGTWREC